MNTKDQSKLIKELQSQIIGLENENRNLQDVIAIQDNDIDQTYKATKKTIENLERQIEEMRANEGFEIELLSMQLNREKKANICLKETLAEKDEIIREHLKTIEQCKGVAFDLGVQIQNVMAQLKDFNR